MDDEESLNEQGPQGWGGRVDPRVRIRACVTVYERTPRGKGVRAVQSGFRAVWGVPEPVRILFSDLLLAAPLVLVDGTSIKPLESRLVDLFPLMPHLWADVRPDATLQMVHPGTGEVIGEATVLDVTGLKQAD